MFAQRFTKPGPGISPEQAQDRGIRRFARVYFDQFWPLVGCNMLFVLCLIPVVTAFPAWKTLCEISRRLADGKNVYFISTFKEIFLQNLGRTVGGGALLAAALGVCGGSTAIYIGVGSLPTILLGSATIAIGLFVGVTAWCFYPMIHTKMALRTLLKQAFLYGIAGLKYHLPALLGLLALAVGGLWFLPYTFPLWLMWFFSFAAMINAFCMRALDAKIEGKKQGNANN